MNPLEALIQQLTQRAGPRGSTFAGRVIPQGQSPDVVALLSQLPTESPDAEGMGGLGMLAGAAGLKRVTTTPIRQTMQESLSQGPKHIDWTTVAEPMINMIDDAIPPRVTGGTFNQYSTDKVAHALDALNSYGPDKLAAMIEPVYSGSKHGTAALIKLAEQLNLKMSPELLKWSDMNIKQRLAAKLTERAVEGEANAMKELLRQKGNVFLDRK